MLSFISVALDTHASYLHSLSIQQRLLSAECCCHLATAVLCSLLPRRPDVYDNDIVVDREHSASIFSRVTFSWASRIIRLSHQQRNLDPAQLPRLDHDTRAQNLERLFFGGQVPNDEQIPDGLTTPEPMWRILVRSSRAHIALIAVACLLLAVLSFAPHMVLLHTLQVLESPSSHDKDSLTLGAWGVVLGLAIICSSILEQQIHWIAYNKLSVRIIEQISLMVFHKAMRLSGPASSKMSKNDGEDGQDCSDAKSIINLVAVDGNRIGRFATYSFHLVLAPMRVLIASVMLMKILGWQSLAAGFLCIAILTPMVIPSAFSYATAGRVLMTARDKKMNILTGMLHGIRQIKFSALEDKWFSKIGLIRNEELAGQRRIFVSNAGIMAFYILAPIALSVASLGAYAVLHNGLTASVTFTAISIMGTITTSLSALPTLFSNVIDTWISTRRLDEYFHSPEKTHKLTPFDKIGFHNATISWSGALTSQKPLWALRNLDLEFPRGELSLISGQTGAGKSLLLASILGECDIIAGQVIAPPPPDPGNISQICAAGGKWTVDSATAYVPQIPWIEAATIQQNIIFGHPFHEKRYIDVLHACALVKDLRSFPDGDQSEIGPDGVNLSGGQKARISLARALYSHAGILLLDDVFSAVDVHTAQHLYKHALTGPLAAGRTRILATHHVGICLPRATFIVHLENARAGFSGPAAPLHASGMLDNLLQSCKLDEEVRGEEDVALEDAPPFPPEHLDTPSSLVTAHSRPATYQAPRTFLSKERGMTDRSALRLFIQYATASGTWWLWALVVAAGTSHMLLTLARVSIRPQILVLLLNILTCSRTGGFASG